MAQSILWTLLLNPSRELIMLWVCSPVLFPFSLLRPMLIPLQACRPHILSDLEARLLVSFVIIGQSAVMPAVRRCPHVTCDMVIPLGPRVERTSLFTVAQCHWIPMTCNKVGTKRVLISWFSLKYSFQTCDELYQCTAAINMYCTYVACHCALYHFLVPFRWVLCTAGKINWLIDWHIVSDK